MVKFSVDFESFSLESFVDSGVFLIDVITFYL